MGNLVTKKGLLKGGKISKNHTTFGPEATRLIAVLKPHASVKKIITGELRSRKSFDGAMRAKIQDTNTGIKVTVSGAAIVQDIFVITDDREVVTKFINDYIEKENAL